MPDVAKVLASTANYMICDDHEFTDDLGEAGEDWKGPQRQQQHEHWAPFFSCLKTPIVLNIPTIAWIVVSAMLTCTPIILFGLNEGHPARAFHELSKAQRS